MGQSPKTHGRVSEWMVGYTELADAAIGHFLNFRIRRYLTTMLCWDPVSICLRGVDIFDPRAFPYMTASRGHIGLTKQVY
jgi:hypothetical protein